MVILSQDNVSKLLRAVSDPTRRRILGLLAQRGRTVSELVAEFHYSQPAISKQLGVLEQAGLVVREREGTVCLCRLNLGSLKPALGWLKSLESQYEERLYKFEQ